MEYYFSRYGDLDLQRRMVSDRRRTRAFADAIYEVVTAAHSVLDVGTGTGLLAMLAARAGATRVHAIDQAEIVQTAANLIKHNGLDEVVKVLRGPAAELELDDKVDLLVSEWLGNMALVEGMLDDVLVARDKNLKAGGRMMPSRVDVLLAPLDDPVLFNQDGPGFWRSEVCGLDMSPLETLELEQGRAVQIRVEAGGLLAEGQSLVSLDLATARSEDQWASGRLTFTAGRDGVLNGFAGWFVAELSPSISLDTSPGLEETHWAQTWFPFQPRPIRQGEKLEVAFEISPDPTERRHIQVKLTSDEVEQTYVVE